MRSFAPRKRCPELDAEVQAAAELLLGRMNRKKIPGLSSLKCIVVVDQHRGRAYLGKDWITISHWLWDRKLCDDMTEMVFYYVAHEMAHFFTYWSKKRNKSFGYTYVSCITGHGIEFMQWFKKICPKEWWHFEAAYTPMKRDHYEALVAAGIKRKQL